MNRLFPGLFALFIATLPLLRGADLGVEHIGKTNEQYKAVPVTLKGTEKLTTQATFRPPVQITITAKTDSTDLRVGYAADQVIFNWRDVPHQLRVDGGPANGQHKTGKGIIPANKYVIIRWVVTSTSQAIYVNEELRFEHSGDYSAINSPVSVFSDSSKVSVKSILVQEIKEPAK
ncbi:hypothetical protein [Verrucomicrobium sp. BvORR106]|uniref:hypothetical protein n=1 Tax=Verrucomicrobium sp. BvORR106 TaxID=1403819 RepID=UPI0005705D3E|nr:hypothetical protein [Verrucomicrobium sp. BvORR106]